MRDTLALRGGRCRFSWRSSRSPPCRASALPAADSAGLPRVLGRMVHQWQPSDTATPENVAFHAWNLPSHIPCVRQVSAHFAPASCACRMPMIGSSAGIVRFILRPLHGADTDRGWRKNPVAGHAPARVRRNQMDRLPPAAQTQAGVSESGGGTGDASSLRGGAVPGVCPDDRARRRSAGEGAVASRYVRPASVSLGPGRSVRSRAHGCRAAAETGALTSSRLGDIATTGG